MVYTWASLKAQRGVIESPAVVEERERTLVAAAWLFLGWALHYVPFWAMGRVLYVHHYYPALLFSSMLTAVLIDYLTRTIARTLPNIISSTLSQTLLGLTLSSCWYSFYIFSPLAYGMTGQYAREANSSIHHLHWMETWEF